VEIDFVVAVFLSSGAGYLAGKHFERKKAMAAFRGFQRDVTGQTIATVNGIMDVVKARLPDLDPKTLIQEIVASCAKYGAQVVAYNPATKHVIKADDNTAE
jgi:hypothetical protein